MGYTNNPQTTVSSGSSANRSRMAANRMAGSNANSANKLAAVVK